MRPALLTALVIGHLLIRSLENYDARPTERRGTKTQGFHKANACLKEERRATRASNAVLIYATLLQEIMMSRMLYQRKGVTQEWDSERVKLSQTGRVTMLIRNLIRNSL